MAGTAAARAEEQARVREKERNNQNSEGLTGAVGPVKHSGIGTSLTKNATNSGGINRATRPVAQK